MESVISPPAHQENRNGKVTRAAMAEAAEQEKASGRRILLSDVVVKRKRPTKVFFSDRKWNAMDVIVGALVFVPHFLALLAPFQFNWGAFWAFVSLSVVTSMFGITLSYHRNLTHRSFKLPKALEYLFAYCGVLAIQGTPINWVSGHRYHHQFCDSEKDPHTPLQGFWYSHMSWIFNSKYVKAKCGGTSNAGDLKKQPFYRFIQKTYIFHPIALGFLLYAFGGLPFIVWGMVGGILAFGEGWHNNHHAFEYSARHGLEWWQVDMTWYVVRLLQALGLASEVKLPSDAHKRRMAFNNGNIPVDR